MSPARIGWSVCPLMAAIASRSVVKTRADPVMRNTPSSSTTSGSIAVLLITDPSGARLPIGKLIDGDTLQITVDTIQLEGQIDLVGEGQERFDPQEGAERLATRDPRLDLAADPDLPPETRLWALLQQLSGGTWGGCVYDPDALADALK